MISFGGFGVGLSVVLTLLVLALAAELFYFLWWKRKITRLEVDDDSAECGNKVFRLPRWKNSDFSTSDASNNSNPQGKILEEESVESELKRLHNLSGPPRFLFTIEEETKEDMAETEDGKSRGARSRKGSRSRSLSDVLMAAEAPLLTPLASSPSKAYPLLDSLESYKLRGLNPLFEAESELYRLKSSPPPTFKFLRDAEDKLFRKLSQGAHKSCGAESSTVVV